MAVSRVMYDAVMKIAKSHPGCKIDKQYSNTTNILVVDGRTNRRWVVDRKGKVRRVYQRRVG